MRIILFTTAMYLIAGCGDSPANQSKTSKDSAQGAEVVNAADKIPATRTAIKKEPVAQYSERTDNPLNEWYFSVKLYETSKTFHYTMKMQFEEIRGTDTLKLPNFGIMPEPVIRKGPDKYSCIIGFLDKDKQFREYKKVYIKNDVLKVTALRHYGVSTYEE